MRLRSLHIILLGVVIAFGYVFYHFFQLQRFPQAPLCNKCNIVFFEIDLLRGDELPCVGYPRNTTPALCNLAQYGSLFTQNISQSGYTLASQVSTLTSTYASTHGIYNYRQLLPATMPTFMDYLKENGYQTEYYGDDNPDSIVHLDGAKQKFDLVATTREHDDWAEQWTSAVRSAQDTQPFFLYFYTVYPHMPYVIRQGQEPIEYVIRQGQEPIERISKPSDFPETQEQIEDLIAGFLAGHYREFFTDEAIASHPYLFSDANANKQEIYQLFKKWSGQLINQPYVKSRWMAMYRAYTEYIEAHGPQAVAYARMLYDTKIQEIDRVVGRVIDYIRSSQALAPRTIIIVYSSHGEEFRDHGGFSHEVTDYQEIIRVPLIISVPGLRARRIASVSQNIDIIPTVFDFIGIQPPPSFQGISLASLMTRKHVTENREAISEIYVTGQPSGSIQNINWKLILRDGSLATDAAKLYNLLDDPGEHKNVAGQNPDLVKKMTQRLVDILTSSRHRGQRAAPVILPSALNEEAKKRLMKGGYF